MSVTAGQRSAVKVAGEMPLAACEIGLAIWLSAKGLRETEEEGAAR